MLIRPARREDFPAILRLLGDIAAFHAENRPDVFEAGYRKYDADELKIIAANPDTPVFVAAEAGACLGYIFCAVREEKKHPPMRTRRVLYVDDLCVDSAHRRMGAATALLAAAEDFGKARGCASAELNVWRFNRPAISLYERAGFSAQKQTMEKNL